MAKRTIFGLEIPKRVLGFKLSKGTRKDLRKLLERLETPKARTLAISALGVLLAYLAEKTAERDGLVGKVASKVASAPKPNWPDESCHASATNAAQA